MYRPHIILLFALLLFGQTAPAFGSLEEASSFAFGGIGVAGTMSDGERELRAVLSQPDAATRLESMLSRASPAGQLYVLLGLRLRDRTAYARALETLRQRDVRVQVIGGCIISTESFRALVSQIEHGKYDSSLSRPAW